MRSRELWAALDFIHANFIIAAPCREEISSSFVVQDPETNKDDKSVRKILNVKNTSV